MAAATNALTVVRPLVVMSRVASEIDPGCTLVNTTVLDEPSWSSLANQGFQAGARVSYLDYVYEATKDIGITLPSGYSPATSSDWRQVGFTNKWRVFDRSSTTRSKQADSMFWRIRPGQICTHAAVIGLVGATSVRLIVANSSDVTIYDKTVSLTGINNLIADQIFTGLPNVANCDLLFYVYGGSSLAVSEIVFGAGVKLGAGVHQGAAIQFQDYSRKEFDEFGEAVLVPRPFARRASFEMSIERDDIDTVMDTLASLRARPCLWIGHPNYKSTTIYGFFKDFSVDIAYATRAICSMVIEGMATQGPSDVVAAPPPSTTPGPTAPPPSAGWTPATIFSGGTVGGWFEAAILYLETTAPTTGSQPTGVKVTQAGDKVGLWLDRSGNDRHLRNASSFDRPAYQIASNNAPCVDNLNATGMDGGQTNGIAGNGSFYGCVAMDITTSSCVVIADTDNPPVAGASGVRVVFDSNTMYCVGYAGGTTYTCSVPFTGPGRCVVQFWFDNSSKSLNLRVNDGSVASVSTGSNSIGQGPGSMGLGRYASSNQGAWNQRFFFVLYTRGTLPLQGDRDACYSYARERAAMTATVGGAPSTGTFPAKVLGCYYTGWATGTYKITDVPMDFNVIYLFHCKPNGTPVNGNYNNVGNGSFFFEFYDQVPAAAIQQCRNRGQKVILTLGGAAAGFTFDTRTKSDNLLASLRTPTTGIIARLGGVDGIDFNNFEAGLLNAGNFAAVRTEMIYIAQQLRITYGNDFAITAPPGAINTGGTPVNGIGMSSSYDLDLMGALADAGVLTYAAPQYYDWSFYNQPGSISGINQQWAARLGATRTVLGLSANYSNGPSLADCIREWDAVKAAHPSIRGMFCWNAQLNLSGGNQWGSAMKARL